MERRRSKGSPLPPGGCLWAAPERGKPSSCAGRAGPGDAARGRKSHKVQREIARAARKPLVSMDFDATACCGRIAPSIAPLAAQSYGQRRALRAAHTKFLAHVKYLLKTQLGMPDEDFRHCELHPIYGAGQVSALLPTAWCMASCRLLEARESKSSGAYLRPPGYLDKKKD